MNQTQCKYSDTTLTTNRRVELPEAIDITQHVLREIIEDNGKHKVLFAGLQNLQNWRLYHRLDGHEEYGANKLLIAQDAYLENQRDMSSISRYITINKPIEHLILARTQNNRSYLWTHHCNELKSLQIGMSNYTIRDAQEKFDLAYQTNNRDATPTMVKRIVETIIGK